MLDRVHHVGITQDTVAFRTSPFVSWDPNRPNSLATFLGHSQLVYNAMWSPHVPACFASVSGDGALKIWNSHIPQRATMTLRAHDAEVLSLDWCKYDQNILATGASDGLIRGWDLRNFSSPVFELKVDV
ncbi:unnamed protein product [Timema podura]|uniref:Peroxin-7 n=1 Tax=Timema podura TaxID=61482 RepID=A0ABN7NQG5_TIMPD|nr:unnamed protein product [Timema podura]